MGGPIDSKHYYRSEQTNQLFEKLFIEHGIGIVLTLPDVGEVRLRGEVARSFLWTIRSHKSVFMIDQWLQGLKDTLKSFKAKETGASETSDTGLEGDHEEA